MHRVGGTYEEIAGSGNHQGTGSPQQSFVDGNEIPQTLLHGIGLCNITKCCTKVCSESIHITDNGIIPMKERVVDQFFDPVAKLFRMFE